MTTTAGANLPVSYTRHSRNPITVTRDHAWALAPLTHRMPYSYRRRNLTRSRNASLHVTPPPRYSRTPPPSPPPWYNPGMIPTIPGTTTYTDCRLIYEGREYENVTVARLHSGEYVVLDPPQIVNLRFDRHG